MVPLSKTQEAALTGLSKLVREGKLSDHFKARVKDNWSKGRKAPTECDSCTTAKAKNQLYNLVSNGNKDVPVLE